MNFSLGKSNRKWLSNSIWMSTFRLPLLRAYGDGVWMFLPVKKIALAKSMTSHCFGVRQGLGGFSCLRIKICLKLPVSGSAQDKPLWDSCFLLNKV
jgi:hypothetical protein